MPEDEGTVAHHVVDIGVAVHVEDARALAAIHEQRVSTDRPEGPHGAVDAAWHQPDSTLHQPRRTVHGELRSGFQALSATSQTQQPPSLHLCIVYYPEPMTGVTYFTPPGELAAHPHRAQRRLFRRKPANSSNPPAAKRTAPITAQKICPVMKLPGSMPMPCNSHTPPVRIINPPTISST